MDKVIVTPLKQISHAKGDIYHAMKKSDKGYEGFGEAYFSCINKNEIKGWKKHTKMILNLIVPVGEVEFVVFDEDIEEFFSIKLSQNNYNRLTVKPKAWVAFRGIGEHNILLNLASIEHDPNESQSMELEKINYAW
ncbi:MAG: dTDP-4-dehydrorhamnose 3,5-epimerase [Arcobacter sp.]|uniref:dTDP-4-dehydrorhamnose 3,5-epimerase n=1 Tax=uncultured Arcobacter sp. TaxID=165434 RepID=UPI000CA8EFAE|nr:dTDP-4-dehydrorhamnose 3,5-epimerase [uncultured Arcobacter sp.]PLY10494.1 MAG: dTDP-4-dehydrorhamnose 3,5-epimerase [Arcobacter sp.]